MKLPVPRPSRAEWAMKVVDATAGQSTCVRRQVGCVLLNVRGHVLATGYNGVASGLKHCNEVVPHKWDNFPTTPFACSGAHSPSGTNLDGCQAIHAEQNALLQCRDVYDIDTCVVSASPCMTCTKLLLNTSCRFIIYKEEYPHAEAHDLWLSAERYWMSIEEWQTQNGR